MERIELDEARLQGQAEIWRYMFSFADSMALKSAVELHIADIIYSYGGAATLSQLASCINDGLTSPDITTLARIMGLLRSSKHIHKSKLTPLICGYALTISDLPYVVSMTPAYNRISHIGGDMFHAIPNADAIIMKLFTVVEDRTPGAGVNRDDLAILVQCGQGIKPRVACALQGHVGGSSAAGEGFRNPRVFELV
ncbi:hypothetical protein PVK06_007069 [Gossypium arboreum]|uniref:Uncharacterized protein n=1 Tax=Gossypium arboreum TaxID=29729 RepID=A0ABR0QGM0_GOSAR|nr:hypothetical protein PVK06_007069 [Gossypium arboreum]